MEILLRTARRVQGVRAEEIARRVGVVPYHLREIEAGRERISKRFRQRFVEAFGQEAAEQLLKPLDPCEFNFPKLRSQDTDNT